MAKMAAANLYRVGDYVYFEANSGAPYQIRRIEELNKTSTGNVEAKVMCFYRRRDISNTLLKAFNRCSSSVVSEGTTVKREKGDADEKVDCKQTPLIPGQELLTNDQRHWLTHRELFLSRQIELLPATHIRGKCSVALLNEVETPDDYLGREDAFFYSLIYDPDLKSLVADKGEIRVGDSYQAEIPRFLGEAAIGQSDGRNDVMIYDSSHVIDEVLLEQYLVIARAVGTFARALDMNTMVKIPSLHMCAASAVRDVTTQQAMNMLHCANYDFGKAVLSFVPLPSRDAQPVNNTGDKVTNNSGTNNSAPPVGGPLMARDQLEEWSAAEANLFEEALEKYGKDFNDIRNDFLPWKSLKNIVEYYYMYKTTDRYVQQKRAKAAEAESRLKQVYIPTYTKPNPNIISSNADSEGPSYSCESCKTTSSDQWYAWGPISPPMRLCSDCWSYWKRYGGLKSPHKYENYDRVTGTASDQTSGGTHTASKYNGRSGNEPMRLNVRREHASNANGILTHGGRAASSARPTNQPKTRSSIYLHTSLWTKVARRLAPKSVYNPRHHARHPCEPINSAAIAQHCHVIPVKDMQNTVKLICRNPVDVKDALPSAGETNPTKRRKRYSHSPNGLPLKRVRQEPMPISDYESWKSALDGCMFSTAPLKKLRQKLPSDQLHRLSRNPFKESKIVLTLTCSSSKADEQK